MPIIKAQVGYWYKDLQTGAQFEVVAVDDNAQTIEAQMLDGSLCEYEQESWSEMALAAVEEPEDWRDVFELSDEDGLDPDQPFHPDTGESPLDRIEPDTTVGLEDDYL